MVYPLSLDPGETTDLALEELVRIGVLTVTIKPAAFGRKEPSQVDLDGGSASRVSVVSAQPGAVDNYYDWADGFMRDVIVTRLLTKTKETMQTTITNAGGAFVYRLGYFRGKSCWIVLISIGDLMNSVC
jgi:hypothetical protein